MDKIAGELAQPGFLDGTPESDIPYGAIPPALSLNNGPDSPTSDLETQQQLWLVPYDTAGNPMSKEEIEEQKRRHQKILDGVMVTMDPQRMAKFREDKMGNSVYSKIVAAMKRLAEEEAVPSTEPAEAAEPTEPYSQPTEIPAGEADALAKQRIEESKNKVKEEAAKKKKLLQELLDSYRREGPTLPEGTKTVELKPEDPEYEKATQLKDKELNAIEDLLSTMLTHTNNIVDKLVARAQKAHELGVAYRTKESHAQLRKLWMKASGIKERIAVALQSQDAINAGIKSLQISPSISAVRTDKRTRTTPGETYYENIPKIMEILEKLTSVEEKMSDPNLSEQEMASLMDEQKDLSAQADAVTVARGRKGIDEPAKEYYAGNRSLMEKAVKVLSDINKRLSEHFKDIEKSGGALTSFPLAHERAGKFMGMMSAIEQNIKDARDNFASVSGERQVMSKAELDKIRDDLETASDRFNNLKMLYAGASEKDAKASKSSFVKRHALASSVSIAEIAQQVSKINQDLDMAVTELAPPSKASEFIDSVYEEADSTAKLLSGVVSELQNIDMDKADVGTELLSRKPESAPAHAMAAVDSSERIRRSISSSLSKKAADKPFKNWWETMKSVVPGMKPKDISEKQKIGDGAEKELTTQVEKENKGIEKEEKKKLSEIDSVKNQISELKQALKDKAGIADQGGMTLEELTVVGKLLNRKYEELAEIAEEKYRTAEAAQKAEESSQEVLIKWQNLMAVNAESRNFAQQLAMGKGGANAKALFIILGNTYGNLVKLRDVDMTAIATKAGRNFSRLRLMKSVLSNITAWARDKKGTAHPTGLAMEIAPDIVLENKEALAALNDLLKNLNTTVKELKGAEAVSIKSLPVRKKTMEEGSVVETTSSDPKYQEIANRMMQPQEKDFPEGETQASVAGGIERVAANTDAVIDKAAATLQEGNQLMSSINSQIDGLSNLYIENKQGLEFLNQVLTDSPEEEPEEAPEGELAYAQSRKEKDMERKAGEFDKFDVSKNRLEIVEGEDGKKKLVINKNLKSLVSQRVHERLVGGFKCGDSVQVDFVDYVGFGTVKAYIGGGVYRVEVDGAVMEVPAKNVMGLDSGPWRI